MLKALILSAILATSTADSRELVDTSLPEAARIPTESSARRVCLAKDHIQAAEQRFSLPDGMLTACMLAEHTLLVDWKDFFADWAAWLSLYKTGSIGFAQMKVSTARLVRPMIFGKNSSATESEIRYELFDQELSMLYAGAYLRHAINTYKKYKVPVRNWTETVCTLYVSGGATKKAKRHARRGTRPRSHFYGRFASRNFRFGKELMKSDCSYRSIKKLLQ